MVGEQRAAPAINDRLLRAAGAVQAGGLAALVLIDPDEWDEDIGEQPGLRPWLDQATQEGMLEQHEGVAAWRVTEKGRGLRSKILRLQHLTE